MGDGIEYMNVYIWTYMCEHICMIISTRIHVRVRFRQLHSEQFITRQRVYTYIHLYKQKCSLSAKTFEASIWKVITWRGGEQLVKKKNNCPFDDNLTDWGLLHYVLRENENWAVKLLQGNQTCGFFGVGSLFCLPLVTVINRQCEWYATWFGKSLLNRFIDLQLMLYWSSVCQFSFSCVISSGPKLTRKMLRIFFFNCFANSLLF